MSKLDHFRLPGKIVYYNEMMWLRNDKSLLDWLMLSSLEHLFLNHGLAYFCEHGQSLPELKKWQNTLAYLQEALIMIFFIALMPEILQQ